MAKRDEGSGRPCPMRSRDAAVTAGLMDVWEAVFLYFLTWGPVVVCVRVSLVCLVPKHLCVFVSVGSNGMIGSL